MSESLSEESSSSPSSSSGVWGAGWWPASASTAAEMCGGTSRYLEREGYGRVRAVVPRLLLGLAEGFVGIGGVRVGGERREQKLGDRGLVEAFIRCQCLIVVK